MYSEFIVDEEPASLEGTLRDALLDLLRQLRQLRQAAQDQKLAHEQKMRAEFSFLRQLLEVKERRCDQFVAAVRARQSANGDGADPVHDETEKWVRRLEAFQQSFETALRKYGVTHFVPSGKALPERDDIKDSVPGEGREPGTIVQVLKPGYLWYGEMLRAAEVVTAQ